MAVLMSSPHIYIPVKHSLYLVAIMDWATRRVLSWRLSNALGASFCVEALEEAIVRYGKPEILDSDQGSQYTGAGWITTLTKVTSKYQWTVGAVTWATSSSNACGDP
jgi:putative transposase